MFSTIYLLPVFSLFTMRWFERSSLGQEDIDEVISRDLHRTFPEHPLFAYEQVCSTCTGHCAALGVLCLVLGSHCFGNHCFQATLIGLHARQT